jgi:uncharacterized protein YggE
MMRGSRALLVGFVALVGAGCVTTVGDLDLSSNAITVSGTGRVNAAPDTALLTLGVESQAPTLGAATADAARRMSAVVARIKAMGVADADITTVSFSVDPRMAPSDPARREEPPRIIGYHVTNLAQVAVRKLPDAGPILDAAVAAGANAVRGIRFMLADPASAQSRARAAAVADALARARELAAAAGLKLGQVLAIRDTGGAPPIPVRGMALRAEATPIEPGQLEVIVSVELQQAIQR